MINQSLYVLFLTNYNLIFPTIYPSLPLSSNFIHSYPIFPASIRTFNTFFFKIKMRAVCNALIALQHFTHSSPNSPLISKFTTHLQLTSTLVSKLISIFLQTHFHFSLTFSTYFHSSSHLFPNFFTLTSTLFPTLQVNSTYYHSFPLLFTLSILPLFFSFIYYFLFFFFFNFILKSIIVD